MNWRTSVCVACMCMPVTLGASAARAQGDSPTVEPMKLRSADGRWVLDVDPSAPDGAGPAKYIMEHDGARAWESSIEWTMRDGRVAASGHVIGYAYDTGYEGWGGQLVTVILRPDGKVLLADKRERNGPAMHVDPPPPGSPRGNGVILDEGGGRGIVRTSLDGSGPPSRWMIYDLAGGKLVRDFTPKEPQSGDLAFSREIAAELVPGAGLVLVHWYGYRGNEAHFDLIDREDRVVWSMDLKGEYAALPDWRWWDLMEKGVRQIEVGEGTFSITSYSLGSRVTYTVAKAGDEWKIAEQGRVPGTPAPKAAAAAWSPAPIELKKLGDIELAAPVATSPIGGITQFSIDDRGRIGWVKWGSTQGTMRFVLVTAEGTVVRDSALELPENEHSPLGMTTWIDGDRWIIAGTNYGPDHQASGAAFWFDVGTGKLQPIPTFKAGSIKCIRRTSDAGFVCLGSLSGAYTIRDQVTLYDRDGKILNEETQPGYGHGDLISDLCVLTDGSIAWLSAVPPMIKIHRAGKDRPEVLDLKLLIGDDAYFADIVADKDGGIIVHDSANGPVLHRIDKDKKVWQTLRVRGPGGEEFRLYDAFDVSPDGRVWASDHHRLYRLDEKGTADLALGGVSGNAMGEPAALAFGPDGAIHVVEAGTARVHIFEPDGAVRKVLTPLPTDIGTQDDLAWITVGTDGTVRYRMSYEGPVMVFGGDGARIGPEPRTPTDYSAPVPYTEVSGSGGKWTENGSTLRRMSSKGTIQMEIARRPRGGWFHSIADASAAPDGTIAVVCLEPEGGMFGGMGPPRNGPWVCTFGADGTPRGERLIDAVSPFATIDFDGRQVLVRDEKSVTIIPMPEGEPRRWEIPAEKGAFLRAYTGVRKGEWLTWSSGSRTLQRWQAPE